MRTSVYPVHRNYDKGLGWLDDDRPYFWIKRLCLVRISVYSVCRNYDKGSRIVLWLNDGRPYPWIRRLRLCLVRTSTRE